ncbi:protein PAT1 homolog 1, partial [Aplysia californica]|uniref:Protein PAT1 homolog 1 n=1 Tax=Aplysia californica TaxID=6500 RepID=A0ABM1AG39_APLCA
MALSRDADRMFSALGAGKLDEDINQLIQAPEEEEEFDILNDETFGDLGDADYDWEDEHKRLAKELEGSSFFDSPREENHTRDSGFVTMDRGLSTTTSTIQEDELERSIRRLVVEDHDSKAFTAFGQPIPGAQRQSHLDELFGPNSPPGYMELEGLASSAGKNIWGSPSADNPFQKPVNNTLQALFASAKQAALRDFPGVFQDARSTPIPAPSMPLPPEVPTLAEIEHSMLAREHQKPQVLTAAELERQLRGEAPLPAEPKPAPFPPMPTAQIPPVGAAVAFRKQPAQGPMGMNPMGPQVPNGESSPINIVRPPGQGFPVYHGGQESPATIGSSPSPSPSQLPPGVPPPHPPQFVMAQSPRLMSPYNPAAVIMANRIFGNAMVRPQAPPTHVPPPGVSSPFGSPYGSPSAAVMASRVSQGGPNMFDQQQSPPGRPGTVYPSGRPYGAHQMQHQPLQYRRGSHSGDRGGHMDPRGNSMSHGHQHFNDRRDYSFNQRGPSQHGYFQRHHHEPGPMEPSDRDSEDAYSGLMTKKEKDWIIKIQLIQLQTDNPYLDDYYYTYYTMRKKAADRDRQQLDNPADRKGNEPELIIPNMIKIEPRTYT